MSTSSTVTIQLPIHSDRFVDGVSVIGFDRTIFSKRFTRSVNCNTSWCSSVSISVFCILDYATEEQINFVVRYYTDIMMKMVFNGKPNKVVYTSLGTSMIGTPTTCGSCPGAK